MKIKGNNSRVLFISLILTGILLIVFNFISVSYSRKQVNDSINNKLSSIISIVLEENPNIDEKEIIRILNSTQNKERDLLKNYGIDLSKENIIMEINNLYRRNYFLNFVISIIIIAIILIIVINYINKENKKIEGIVKLINDINNKIYKIDILDEGEDNLSNLRNEIYKTSMLLKLDADESKKVKESVLKSVADISHQLKTPLSSISIMLDNVIETPKMPLEKRNEYLKQSQNQIMVINNLIVSLLKISKIDAGVIKFKKESINLKKMLDSIKDLLNINLELKNISLNILCKKDVSITGDYSWEIEALKNIIKNAIDASLDNSNIDILVKENNFYVSITIKDYGKGIEKEELKHIFERFYKLNDDNNSFGIGLSLAKMIIESDGGMIDVESKIKEGTTFTIKYMK